MNKFIIHSQPPITFTRVDPGGDTVALRNKLQESVRIEGRTQSDYAGI